MDEAKGLMDKWCEVTESRNPTDANNIKARIWGMI